MSNSIATNLERLVDAKDAIISAISAKGGTVSQTAGLEDLATAIGTIQTSVASYISSGLVFESSDEINPKENSQEKVCVGVDYTNGYTLESSFTMAGAASNTLCRTVVWDPNNPQYPQETGIDSIAFYSPGNQLDLLVNGKWFNAKTNPSIDITIEYNTLCTASLIVNPDNTGAVYVNGELAASLTSVPSITSDKESGVYWFIGCANVRDRIFNGVIHSTRIYNRPLSSSEIASNRATDEARFGS